MGKKLVMSWWYSGGNITVRFLDGFADDPVDEIFRLSRHIIDSTILAQVVLKGTGLSYTLSHYRKDNEVFLATPDQVPTREELRISVDDLIVLMGRKPELRYALLDFNMGLIYREDCPIHFYRSIETLARIVTGLDKIDGSVWNDFHAKLGTSRDDLDELYRINISHRHGTHTSFNKDEHRIMMETTKYFLVRTIHFLVP